MTGQRFTDGPAGGQVHIRTFPSWPPVTATRRPSTFAVATANTLPV
ncbi:hypothetical protein [Streptomyces sp. NPDC088141]